MAGGAGGESELLVYASLAPHLDADQKTVWNGLQKILINSWNNGGRRQPDEQWWGNMPNVAAKAKAIPAKANPAKANPAKAAPAKVLDAKAAPAKAAPAKGKAALLQPAKKAQ